MRKRTVIVSLLGVLVLLWLALPAAAQAGLSQKQQLGKALFFDTNLSTPAGMSCATCHDPAAGFADPRPGYPVSQGIIPTLFGNRNSPTAAYAAFSPVFQYMSMGGGGMGGGGMGGGGMGGGGMGGYTGYVGGQFWDGRASTLAEQAKGPFLNPLEMNNGSKAEVVTKVRSATYAGLFRTIYGKSSLNNVDAAYDRIADAIAEYERSTEVVPFTSKYDYYVAGQVQLTTQEQAGLTVFSGKGKCSSCHMVCMGGGGMGGGMGGGGMGMMSRALFTDFRYRNLGTPANPANPFYSLPAAYNPLGASWIDSGLGDALRNKGVPEAQASLQDGKMKTPTLRNIARTAPYMHNGVFGTLAQVVHFYNTGRVLTSMGMPMTDEVWPAEVSRNIQPGFVGSLGLTQTEGMALIAFLNTLTDGYQR